MSKDEVKQFLSDAQSKLGMIANMYAPGDEQNRANDTAKALAVNLSDADAIPEPDQG